MKSLFEMEINKFNLGVIHNIPYFVSKMDLNSFFCLFSNRYSQLIDTLSIGIIIYMY